MSSSPVHPSGKPPMQPELYPVFLKLAGLPVVVVGGGAVAAGKLAGLLAAGARITVVAPAIHDAIRALPVAVVERGFTASDLDGARWVVAAATPEAVSYTHLTLPTNREV